jgi:hypothetical protein
MRVVSQTIGQHMSAKHEDTNPIARPMCARQAITKLIAPAASLSTCALALAMGFTMPARSQEMTLTRAVLVCPTKDTLDITAATIKALGGADAATLKDCLFLQKGTDVKIVKTFDAAGLDYIDGKFKSTDSKSYASISIMDAITANWSKEYVAYPATLK